MITFVLMGYLSHQQWLIYVPRLIVSMEHVPQHLTHSNGKSLMSAMPRDVRLAQSSIFQLTFIKFINIK